MYKLFDGEFIDLNHVAMSFKTSVRQIEKRLNQGMTLEQAAIANSNLQNDFDVKKHIEANINTENGTGCWEWTKGCTESGYGQFNYKGKNRRAHREAYRIFRGVIPEGLVVRHMCHNPKCCNPHHLEVGTAKDNALDMTRAGRGYFNKNCQSGEGNAIFNKEGFDAIPSEVVIEMRELYRTGSYSTDQIGEMFGISGRKARRAIRGDHYSCLNHICPPVDYKELRENGLNHRVSLRVYSNITEMFFIKDLSFDDISGEVGLSVKQITRFLRGERCSDILEQFMTDFGITETYSQVIHRRELKRQEEALTMYTAGFSKSSIMKKLKYSYKKLQELIDSSVEEGNQVAIC